MSDVTLQSTTDTPEAVNEALGIKPSEVKEPAKQEPEPEKPTAEDSEPPAKEVDEPEDEEKSEDKPAKKGGFQRRIDKLTSETYQLQAQNAELMRQLAAKAAVQPAEQPKAEGEPKAEDFDSYEKYVRAVAKFELKTELDAQRRAYAEAEQQKQLAAKHTEFQAAVQTARGKYEDFDEVVNNPQIPITPVMRDVVLDSDQAAELAYYLGKNPSEAARISQLSPVAQARELGKLEAKIAIPVTTTAAEGKKVTNAPAPIRPVGTKPSGTVKDPSQMDYQEYKKWRESQTK